MVFFEIGSCQHTHTHTHTHIHPLYPWLLPSPLWYEYILLSNAFSFAWQQALAGECGFMAANLYARSIFGEDALANVSIEKPSDQSGPSVTGHVRIRAKSQVTQT